MKAALVVLLMVAFGTSAQAGNSARHAAPSYTAGSIVNWATGTPGPFAPNAIVTIYGTELAYSEEAAAGGNIKSNKLPTKLAGVTVMLSSNGMGGVPVHLYYVGPRQINFVLPASHDPGDVYLLVQRDGMNGAPVRITLQDAAPALLRRDDTFTRATHASGAEITPEDPARPGEVVVLYGTGLGPTVLALEDGEVPAVPARPLAGLVLKRLNELRVTVAGQALDPARIWYAGLTPGIAGLYQINVQLPDELPPDPEIRVAIGERISPEGLKLAARPLPPPAAPAQP